MGKKIDLHIVFRVQGIKENVICFDGEADIDKYSLLQVKGQERKFSSSEVINFIQSLDSLFSANIESVKESKRCLLVIPSELGLNKTFHQKMRTQVMYWKNTYFNKYEIFNWYTHDLYTSKNFRNGEAYELVYRINGMIHVKLKPYIPNFF